MGKHSEKLQKKSDDKEQKHRTMVRKSGESPESSKKHTETSLTAETPFLPRMKEHAARLAGMPFTAQRNDFIMQLNNTYGYRYVQRLMKSVKVQGKLTVSDPNDVFEQEADRVADTVTRSLQSQTQRQVPEEEELIKSMTLVQREMPEEEELLQGKVDIERQTSEEEEELQASPLPQHRTLQKATIQRKPPLGAETGKLVEEWEKRIRGVTGSKEEKEAEVPTPTKTEPSKEEEKTSQPVEKVPTQTKAKPPIPRKTFRLEPLMQVKYEKRFASMKPVKEMKKEMESYFRASKPLIMTPEELKGRAGEPTKKDNYKQICDTLEKYFSPTIQISDIDMTNESKCMDKLNKQFEYLKTLKDKIGSWWEERTHDTLLQVLFMTNKKMKKPLEELNLQVEDEKNRLEEVKSAISTLYRDYNKGTPVKYLTQYAHFLEAYDPKHRDYNLLGDIWDIWIKEPENKEIEWAVGLEPPPTKFFTWLEANEKKPDEFIKWLEIKGAKKSTIEEAKKLSQIKYYTIEERNEYKLTFDATAKPSFVKSGRQFERGIYVLSPGGEFYARKETEQTKMELHHSSFLAGQPVAAAGKMEHKGILHITLESGHYQPKVIHMVNAVIGLEKNNVDLKKVMVHPFLSNISTDAMMADKFKKEFEELKNWKLKELEEILKKKEGIDLAIQANNDNILTVNILKHNEIYLQILDAVNA